MITPGDFFEQLQIQLNKNLPFVAYRIPGSRGITKALLQQSSELYKIEDFQEKGFLFAPFDDEKEAVLIPVESSEILETQFEIYESNLIFENNISGISDSSAEKDEHQDLVEKGIDTIKKGTFKKVVLSRKEVLEIKDFEPVIIFERLLENYPAAFVYCWFHPEVGMWLGATPETLLEVERNRFKTMALAGTKKYEGTKDVAWDEKEKEEQQIVTVSILENLKNISSENIETAGPFTTQAGNLLHLRTDIKGIFNPGTDDLKCASEKFLKELISAIHPTPAVCGLPREPAKKFILENEKYDREFYTGYLGELNMKKTLQRSSNRKNRENQAYSSIVERSALYVNLRCMKLEKDRAFLYIGGGITRDSDAEAEWEETLNKAETMKAVLFRS